MRNRVGPRRFAAPRPRSPSWRQPLGRGADRNLDPPDEWVGTTLSWRLFEEGELTPIEFVPRRSRPGASMLRRVRERLGFLPAPQPPSTHRGGRTAAVSGGSVKRQAFGGRDAEASRHLAHQQSALVRLHEPEAHDNPRLALRCVCIRVLLRPWSWQPPGGPDGFSAVQQRLLGASRKRRVELPAPEQAV
jgi:hypothetical protein